MATSEHIRVRGASQNNLAGIDIVEEGRTVLVVEHDLDIVARADWVIDLGPGAGHEGGTIVFEGPPAKLANDKKSLTGKHLAEGRDVG